MWHDSTIPARSSPVVPAVCIRILRSSRIQRFEESEHLGQVVRSHDGERSVTDEQVRADRRHPVDVAGDCIDGYPLIEGDPRSDQGAPFDTSLNDEQHIRQSGNDPVSGRKHFFVVDGLRPR